MIRYKQEILGRGSEFDEPPGDCFATAIASVLELPRERVPNFCAGDRNWWSRLQEWLRPFGFFYLEISLAENDPDAKEILKSFGWHIITGQGPRGAKHSVVGYAGEIIHDPHPSDDGLLTTELFGVFVPILPHEFISGIIPKCGASGEVSQSFTREAGALRIEDRSQR